MKRGVFPQLQSQRCDKCRESQMRPCEIAREKKEIRDEKEEHFCEIPRYYITFLENNDEMNVCMQLAS